ncbi:hypothetical protein BU25DRAFT_461849 [Macroventuria anomochaeta]|uniref:Uncharacterized protein n=1 Tax=Macroventuria anomochaeta TaxID=301207 RepID=A0ACB6RS70_9PLEO|nr:uncharacterized protein BU25DRAFT_461849 [Macroventuria anomochaeta]KAF2623769.1 hypothetical protein BU25DRAFT_461849 [Macroventuria anomochaeta]
MFLLPVLLGLALPNLFVYTTTLLAGGIVITWDEATHSLEIVRNGSALVEDGTITAVPSANTTRLWSPPTPTVAYTAVPTSSLVLDTLGFLNQSISLIFAHASYLNVADAQLLR